MKRTSQGRANVRGVPRRLVAAPVRRLCGTFAGLSMYQLYNGDCLEIMPTLPAQSVDAIITDLPYGTTACAWDSVIPFDDMWRCVKHVLKPNGAFVTTASQPFTSLLINSNLKWFRYEWIWDKKKPVGWVFAKKQPMRQHENILVFYDKSPIYNPQPFKKSTTGYLSNKESITFIETMGDSKGRTSDNLNEEGYARSILYHIPVLNNLTNDKAGLHPTQKPVKLYTYLVLTYTNPGDTVLDMCFGSNTTGVACIETGRKYIGIENDRKYFELGQRRIEQAQPPLFVETGTPANKGLQPTPQGAVEKSLFN